MIRLNRARWLHLIRQETDRPLDDSFWGKHAGLSIGRGIPELKQWLWRHKFAAMTTWGRLVITDEGRRALRAWCDDAARHNLKLP